MPHYQPPRRSATPPSYPYNNFYPGISPFEAAELPLTAEASALSPFTPAAAGSSLTTLPAAAATETAASAASGFSLANIGGIVERLGGIEGIIATMGKVQKVMQTVQQFAPMAKMFAGLLPGGKGPKLQGGNSGKLDEYRPRRRSRSKKGRKSPAGSRSRKKTGRRRR